MRFGFLRNDVSDSWPIANPQSLRFDSRARDLNGLAFGAPVDAVARFGRPDNRRAVRKGEFEYRTLGLTIGVDALGVSWFAFSFDDPDRYDFDPCSLTFVLPDGGSMELAPGTRRVDLERAFGQPYEDLDGGDERGLMFKVGASVLEVAVDLSGRLMALDVNRDGDRDAPAG